MPPISTAIRGGLLGLILAGPLLAAPTPADAVVVLMHQAAEERRRGDYAAAAGTYHRVIRRAPDLFEARLFLADSLRRLRRSAEAEQEFLAARRIRPEDPLPYVGLAERRREEFRYSEALVILDEWAQIVPLEKREAIVVEEGLILRQMGNPAASVRTLEEAAGRFPESSRIQEGLARGYEAQGRIPEAVGAWSKAVGLAPDNAASQAARAEAQALQEKIERAESATRRPEAARADWENLARLDFLARRDRESARAAKEALRSAGGARSDLLLLRGRALERAGGLEEAEAEFRRIAPESPEHLTSLYHLAFLARARGDGVEEEKVWSEAARRHPRDPAAGLMLILCWKRGGVLAERLEELRREQTRLPDPNGGERLLILALQEAGSLEEAAGVAARRVRADPLDPEGVEHLDSLLALQPKLLARWIDEERAAVADPARAGTPAPALFLSLLLRTGGDARGAEEVLRRAGGRFPERPEIPLLLAAGRADADGKDPEVDRWLDRAVKLNPGSPWGHLQRGLWLLQKGAAPQAVAEAGKVVAIAPALPEGHQLLGSARRVAGDYAGATESFHRALQLDPADSPGVIRFQLSLALAAAGRHPEARQALEGEVPAFPDLIYRLAWSFTAGNFLDRTFGGQDWASWRDRFADPGASPAAAHAAIARMLESLGDPYTRLRGTEETEALYLSRRSSRLEIDRSGTPLPTSQSVIASDLGENIGYLRLTSFSDPSAREAIRKALEGMALRDGLVLDLRGNAGGISAEAEAIAGMLLEPGDTVGLERTRNGEDPRPPAESPPAASRKPLVVLTDRRTGSAAEKLAAGLKGARGATVIGDPTFGKGRGQMNRLLPGGTMVLVTAVENLTREGEPIQGRGVRPDLPADEDPIEKAKELLRKPSP